MAEKSFKPKAFGFVLPPKLIAHASERCLEIKGRIKVLKAFNIAASQELTCFLGQYQCESSISNVRHKENGCISHFDLSLIIPLPEIYQLPIHNVLCICVGDIDEPGNYHRVKYCSFISKYMALHSKYYQDEESSLTCFMRQNVAKNATFTVRHSNVTDSFSCNARLLMAYFASRFFVWKKPILLFEKNGSHYEESGSIVFERLADEGYPDVFFVLNKIAFDQFEIDKKYRKRILIQHSFKHYVYFFRANTFLGTEVLAHALELRCQNVLVQRKIDNRRNTFVFLQHGISYMVSFDSPSRASFRKNKMKGKCFVVVSSELEARHFIDCAGFKSADLILCGLPKFDRSYKNKDADKIVIMPTWRIWEFNEMRNDPESTKYVQMIKRMVGAIPSDLQDKVVVVKHPLFNESTFSLGQVQEISNYDKLLRDAALLITDYSSISYDAFYRGSNVVFYWEEKDECMNRYGKGAHLMIDEQTAFGPVCFSQAELAQAVSAVYSGQQSVQDMQKYSRIVEFHDGKNTDRLLEELCRLNVIPKR